MTIEERDTARAIQALNRKMKNQTEIDWEQRRYEIAKECLPAFVQFVAGITSSTEFNFDNAIKLSVATADALIIELKKIEE